MNHKSVRFLEDFRSDFVDPEYNNDPKFAILFMLSAEGIVYERRVGSILDLLGKVGGVSGAIEFLIVLFVYIFTINYSETK
jgi:hypothetical protein